MADISGWERLMMLNRIEEGLKTVKVVFTCVWHHELPCECTPLEELETKWWWPAVKEGNERMKSDLQRA